MNNHIKTEVLKFLVLLYAKEIYDWTTSPVYSRLRNPKDFAILDFYQPSNTVRVAYRWSQHDSNKVKITHCRLDMINFLVDKHHKEIN